MGQTVSLPEYQEKDIFCKTHNLAYAAHKMKFSIKGFFSKCDHIRRKLRIWSHLLTKPYWITSFFFQC